MYYSCHCMISMKPLCLQTIVSPMKERQGDNQVIYTYIHCRTVTPYIITGNWIKLILNIKVIRLSRVFF